MTVTELHCKNLLYKSEEEEEEESTNSGALEIASVYSFAIDLSRANAVLNLSISASESFSSCLRKNSSSSLKNQISIMYYVIIVSSVHLQ